MVNSKAIINIAIDKGHCSVLGSVVTRAVVTKGGLPQSGASHVSFFANSIHCGGVKSRMSVKGSNTLEKVVQSVVSSMHERIHAEV